MSSDPEQFASLVARARQGDASALAKLVELYEPEVRIVARVLLGRALRPYLDSVDLVQSVHGSLIRGLRDQKFDFSSPDNLLGLALTMVRRKAAQHWRRAQRQQRLESRTTDPEQSASVLTALYGRETDPARVAQANDQVRHLLNQLNEVDRRLVGMWLNGLGSEEIARELGMDAGAVRVRWTRLRKRLRETARAGPNCA